MRDDNKDIQQEVQNQEDEVHETADGLYAEELGEQHDLANPASTIGTISSIGTFGSTASTVSTGATLG